MILVSWPKTDVCTLARIDRIFGTSRERIMTVSCPSLK